MNKSFILALALALPLAQSARADDHKNRSRRDSRSADQPSQAQVQQTRQQGARQPQQYVPRSNFRNPPRRVPTATRNVDSARAQTTRNSRPDYNRSVTNRNLSNPAGSSDRFRDRSRENNARVPSNGAVQNRGNTAPNRPHRDFDRNSFAAARHRGVHGNHHRDWWRSHYNTTFVLFGGGYYYWDAGWWYPAYGYDPYYNNYAYSEPIYGYNDLAPGEILENVQIALRDEGYYDGAIDGLIGPQTRAALGAFQRDNGLVVTEAVDEATLVMLGLA